MRNPFRRDLILLHAPAFYDFRARPAFLGPVADAVPSTAIFEMYPVGLTSIASYLERNSYNVEIVNVAYRMLRDPAYDVDAHLRRMSAPIFGIDLHWLPHVQGALALAERVKALHPESRILMGGLSASYYHDELIRYPFVDFVMRGDSTEEPVRQLLQSRAEQSCAASRMAALSDHAAAHRARMHAGLRGLRRIAVGLPADLPSRQAGVPLAGETRGGCADDRQLLARADLHGSRSADGRHGAC